MCYLLEKSTPLSNPLKPSLKLALTTLRQKRHVPSGRAWLARAVAALRGYQRGGSAVRPWLERLQALYEAQEQAIPGAPGRCEALERVYEALPGALLALSLALVVWTVLSVAWTVIPWTGYLAVVALVASVVAKLASLEPATLQWLRNDAGVLDLLAPLLQPGDPTTAASSGPECAEAWQLATVACVLSPPRGELELLSRALAPTLYPKLAARKPLLPRSSEQAFAAARSAWVAQPKDCASLQLQGLALLQQAAHGDRKNAHGDRKAVPGALPALAWSALRGMPPREAREQFVSLAWKLCPQLWQRVGPTEGGPTEQRAEACATLLDARLGQIGPALAAVPLSLAALLLKPKRGLVIAALAYAYSMVRGLPLGLLAWKFRALRLLPYRTYRAERHLPRRAARALRILRLFGWVLLRHLTPRVRPHPALELADKQP